MNFDEFRLNAIAEVEQRRHEMGEGLRKAFVDWMNNAVPEEDGSSFETLYLSQKFKTRNVGVDGYFYDEQDGTLILVIADWNEFPADAKLNRADAAGYFKRLRSFFEFCREGSIQATQDRGGILEWSTPEYGLADLIHRGRFDRIRMLLYTDRELSDRFKTLDNTPIGDIAVEESVWTLERLYELKCSGRGTEAVELDFSDEPVPLTLATQGKGFRSYLGVMSAWKLAAMYKQHGGRLLEGNVRSFLSLRSTVNKDIRATILKDPEHFFVYNNGIAVTVEDMTLNDKGKLLKATDFQIINGGQTTASLARAVYSDKADVSRIRVAVKLTHVDKSLEPEEARRLIRNISRSSNNQNKVSNTDFSSSHEFHILMEKYAATNPAPGMLHHVYWYYERNRGSFEQEQMFLTRSEKSKFETKYKKHVLKKEPLARVRLVWEGRPEVVALGNVKLFAIFMNDLQETWSERRDAGFYDAGYFRDSVSLWIIREELQKAVTEAPWYDKGYRANIVDYSMAAFAWMFTETYPGHVFDLSRIWKGQTVPEELMEVLLEIARNVKTSLMSLERKKENVTEWAKMPECWARVKKDLAETKYRLPSFLEDWSQEEGEKEERKSQGKKQAESDAAMKCLGDAIEYGFWKEAVEFADACGILMPEQTDAMRKCSDITGFPSEEDARLAFESLETLRNLGFES